jgi:sec-independent protein translocase protein TatA
MFRSPLIDALVVIVILLLIVGPKKLPQLGRGLGDGMREFKDGITGEHKDDDDQKVTLSQAPPMPHADATGERPTQTTGAVRHDAGTDRSA